MNIANLTVPHLNADWQRDTLAGLIVDTREATGLDADRARALVLAAFDQRAAELAAVNAVLLPEILALNEQVLADAEAVAEQAWQALRRVEAEMDDDGSDWK